MSLTATRIKELRLNKNMSQADLAKVLNMKRENVSNYERGTITNLPSEVLEKLANYFNVSTDYLLGRTDTPEKSFYSEKALDVVDMIMNNSNNIFMEIIENLPILDDSELKVVNDMIKSLVSLKQKKS